MYAGTVQIWDASSGKLSDFTTHFNFIIDTHSEPKYGHGLAFFLAPVGFQIPPNSAGGFLGLYNTSNTDDSSANQIVSVEFDSFINTEWDPLYEHVGINKNSVFSSVKTPWNASLHSGDTADVWIVYNASITTLSVFWSYQENPNFRKNSTLSYQIDLRESLPEIVTIGFSSTTSQFAERVTIKSWEFNSTLTKEDSSTHDTKVKFIVSTTVSVGVLLSLSILFFYFWFRRRLNARKASEEAHNQTLINIDDLERAGPRRFSYQSLVVATNNFSDDRKLGEGGFGCVYKGYLTDLDIPIAVKKISRGSRQGKKEYLTEVKVISRLRHRNLVQLIGWCHDQGDQFLLAYEFMPNGSLDVHLFGKKTPLIAWAVRYKITLGFASALLYLHEECEQCVVHRDIKSSNIMLDSNFNLKLGDFGLARLMDHELGPQTTDLAGTYGYMAPEYVSTGKASKLESDIYSFGGVVLEIVTGRRSMSASQLDEKSEMRLVEWVWNLYGSGELVSGVDERLKMVFDAKQAACLMIVGLWCAHPDWNFRPSIRQAIQVLNFELALPSLPSKMPVPVYHAAVASYSSSNLEVSSSSGAIISYTSIDVGR